MRAAGVQGWRYALEVLVVALVLVLICAGCAGLGDDERIVHPIEWHEVSRADLSIMCPEAERGCVVSRSDGDHIYTLPVVRK